MKTSEQYTTQPLTRIILAEDHLVVRDGLRNVLEKDPGIRIVGEAANGNEVLEMVLTDTPADLVVTDLNMPGMNGIELIDRLKEQAPQIKLVVLSMLDNEKFVIQAFKAGAVAYLLKSVSSDELLFAIRHVMSGGEYVCSEIAMRCMKRLVKAPELPQPVEKADLHLSDKDTEVLSLIAEGYTNQEIADKLFTSKRTVEGYRQQLMNKTGSRNTAALIRFAAFHGLIN